MKAVFGDSVVAYERQATTVLLRFGAAGAHPMAVALAPVPRIDYSVTKGGARTWAVLLVFLFLCSGLYTIFSSKELNGNDANIHSDQQEEVGDDSQSYSDLSPKQRRNTKESEDSDIKEDSSEVIGETTADDDDDTEVETPLEDQLFAGLRRKIEKNIQRVKEFVKEHEGDKDKVNEETEEAKVQTPLKRGKRRKNKVVEPSDDEQEEAKEPKCSHRHRRKGKTDKECEQEADVEETDSDDDDSKEDDLPKTEPSEEDNPEEDNDEEEEKEDEDDDEEESKTEERFVRKQRSHGFRHLLIDAEPERECRRKHCPPDYHAAPRKSLLKKKYKGPNAESASGRPDNDNAKDDEDDEDDEDDDEDDQPDPRSQIKHSEVVALNKRGSGREAYKRQAITNRDDHKNRDSLDRADNFVEKHNYDEAFAIFDSILRARPDSPRAHFGKGRGYQLRGELTSNDIDFAHAIQEYEQVLDNEDTPSALFRQAASRLIELASFRGDFYRCLLTHRSLVDRFPEEVDHQIDVALTFIKMKRLEDAKKVLHNIIENDPNNAVALAYYGYILKVAEDNTEQGVAYMKKGLRLGGGEITDANRLHSNSNQHNSKEKYFRFYYHLGQGLMMLGRPNEAYSVFEHAATLGLFLSAQQRSMYNVEGLTGRAWWSSEQTGYAKYLKAVERQWVSIRAEAARVYQSAPNSWKEENPTITVDGRWTAFPLLENGHFNSENCELAPQTCSILKEFRESSNASRSELQFDGASSSSLRLILLIDLWHPEVESQQRTAPEDD
ncbi:hypothetical protein Aduo_017874 [Ancylostoma duodenale]